MRGVSGRGGYLPVELLLGRIVPRVLAFVSLGRHPVGRWCCGASAWDRGTVVVQFASGQWRGKEERHLGWCSDVLNSAERPAAAIR